MKVSLYKHKLCSYEVGRVYFVVYVGEIVG